MSEHQEYKTFEEDGTRPIESRDIEVADTFKEDGIRPIAESPDYLVRNRATENNDEDNCKSETPSTENSAREVRVPLNIKDEPIIDSSNLEAGNILEIDGKRPITSQ
ncbi:hypothetical protein IQ238_03375 [Pleurocapsales cyanobacterium LEGE 06147]|nr:hypothetical protein [Pleurocapsales cyanobacterium LEGE 06147]